MMKTDIRMQTGAIYKPEGIEDAKIHDNEQYKVSPHMEFIIRSALTAVVILTLLAFIWKSLSTGSVNTSGDYIKMENVEVDLEE